MTANIVLDTLQKFLANHVCSRIQLQRPCDNDISKYELTNPEVHIGWIPPNGYLPDGMETAIPCMIIGAEEGQDNGDEAGIDIRISFIVFSPGIYEPNSVKFTPDFQGYRDLLNLIQLTQLRLSETMIIEGMTSVEKPFKWGMYKDQPYPYWYGWLTFRATCSVLEFLPPINEGW